MSAVDDTVSAKGAYTVAPNDSVDLPVPSRGIYVGTAGHLKVTMQNGSEVTFVTLAAGLMHPLYVKRVWSTGTTADDIIVAT